MQRALLAASLVLVAVPAWAAPGDPCTADADCGSGEACEVAPCAGCDPDGGDCPPCRETGVCAVQESPSLVGPSCATDADCPLQFVCESVTLDCPDVGGGTDCGCPPCEAGGECPPCDCGGAGGGGGAADPAPCEPTTALACVFHVQSCDSDASCADGFACTPIESCSGVACACGGDCACPECPAGEECPCDCPPPEECVCDEEPPTCTVEAQYCLPPQITCTGAADCPDGWTCEDFGGASGGSGDCACACEPGGECPPCDCDDAGDVAPPSESYCLPPGWADLVFGGGLQSGGDFGGGGEASAGGWPFEDDRGGEAGDGGGDDAAGGSSSGSGGDADSAGCTAAAGTPGLLALAGALLGLARQRRSSRR